MTTEPRLTDVEAIWEGISSHRVDLSRTTPDLTVPDGEAVQLAVLGRHLEQGSRRGGWKVGMTSGAGRDSLGAGVRPFGYLLASQILPSGARVDSTAVREVGLETELCFRLGAVLGGERTTAADARAAVDGVAAAFEVNEERLDPSASGGVKVADNLRQWAIVTADFGPVPDQAVLDGLVSSISRDGEPLQTIAGEGHIDDHFESLAALARELASFGQRLEAGDVVITGAYTRIGDLAPGHYVGTFEGVGEVALDLV
ncbi:MAG: fumarylacetoacetate hydrolase family protein [Nocardioides sp.]